MHMANFVELCYTAIVVIPTPATERGCIVLTNAFVSFLVTVAGGVVCHYIIKWLDGNDNDNDN